MGSNKAIKRVRYALRFLPDSIYIQLNYLLHFKKFANLKNPKTFNEKLNWLKLHDRNPLYTKMVDKYEVKKYVEKIIGDYQEHNLEIHCDDTTERIDSGLTVGFSCSEMYHFFSEGTGLVGGGVDCAYIGSI